MTPRMTVLAGELEALRSEIAALDAIETPSEEEATRFQVALTEWDAKKKEHDELASRAEAVAAVRDASIHVENVESGFHSPNVIVRKDPFENVRSLSFSYDDKRSPERNEDIVARAVTGLTDYRPRDVSDEAVQNAVRAVETVPGAAQHALIHGSPAYRSAFNTWMKAQGNNPLYTPEEADAVRTAMSTSGANGGYTLPTLLDPTLIHTGTASKSSIRAVSRVVTGTQNVWHGVSVTNVSTYWKGEGSAMTEGSPTFSNPSVTAAMLTAYVTGSYEIFEDSNLQAQLPGLIAEAMNYAETDAFIVGSGSSAPKGVITAISGTAASTVTATTRGSFTTASAVDVFALLNALPSRYEDSATWVANKVTFNVIKQMSTASNGSYFWTDFNAAIGSPLLGSPIVQSSAVSSATTSGTVLVVLGDFSQFVIYDRIGMSVEFMQNVVDGSGLPTGQRGLIAHKRVGSDCTDINAFRFLKT